MFGISIIDASSRININLIAGRAGKHDPAILAAVENILLSMDADPDLALQIADFIDSDENGEHEEDYCLNRPLHNLSELGLIRDFPYALLHRKPAIKKDTEEGIQEEPKPTLYDYFTVHSQGRINVNTAPAEVLLAILPNQADEDAVYSIIEEREAVPFKSVTDVFKVQGASRGMFGAFEQKLTVTPSVFIAEAEDVQGPVTRRARAVFRKTGKRLDMIYYHEE
jgi:type II secretory pathway component PulK